MRASVARKDRARSSTISRADRVEHFSTKGCSTSVTPEGAASAGSLLSDCEGGARRAKRKRRKRIYIGSWAICSDLRVRLREHNWGMRPSLIVRRGRLAGRVGRVCSPLSDLCESVKSVDRTWPRLREPQSRASLPGRSSIFVDLHRPYAMELVEVRRRWPGA